VAVKVDGHRPGAESTSQPRDEPDVPALESSEQYSSEKYWLVD